MTASFTTSCLCPLVSPFRNRVRTIRQHQGRQDPSFSGSNRCQWRYRPGPPHSIRLQAQPNVDFPAPSPKAAGNPKIDRPNRTGTMNPVKALENHGQAVWLDFLARGFVAKGDLQALIDTDGVKGVTSNPSIFEKAIGSSDEYDGAIGRALKAGDRPVADLFEALAIEDIQNAADVLRPVYDRLNGEDGFVSLEVSPYLAMDTKGTIAEAERLWKDVKRKNVMVKVPATPEGLPAIEHLIGEGISINITLLFSQKVYLQVAEAYLAGLEKFVRNGGDPSDIASVASFFVSRIDTMVDKELDEKIAKANDPTEKERLSALKGKVAIANAKLAYQDRKSTRLNSSHITIS